MCRLLLTALAGMALASTMQAQDNHFLRGHLAVLRAGDGVIDLDLRQSPVFVDQFTTNASNAAPSFTVRIPTNGPGSFFFNGHAASEGNLTRSADHKLLAFAGYGGVDLLHVNGTASRLDIPRGFTTVDGLGAIRTYFYKNDMPEAKINPRGVVTDGTNNFWACGNASGTFYFHPSGTPEIARFATFPNSRAINIINNTVYASMNSADGVVSDQPAGIYNFLPAALPRTASAVATLAVPSADGFKRVVGFDINPAETVAYMADTKKGIQKYTKFNGRWAFAYNFTIPQNIPKELNNSDGCFGLVADFSGAAPVIFATTTEGYGNSVNSNRVVRIVDTNANAAIETVAQAASTNIAFRGVAFTPE